MNTTYLVTNSLENIKNRAILNTRELKRIAKSNKGIYIDASVDLRDYDAIMEESSLKSRIFTLKSENKKALQSIKDDNDAISNIEQEISDFIKRTNKTSGKRINSLNNIKYMCIRSIQINKRIISINNRRIRELSERIKNLSKLLKSTEEVLRMCNMREYTNLMQSNYHSHQLQMKTTLINEMTKKINHYLELELEYDKKLDEIIPGLSDISELYTARRYFDDLTIDDRQRIYDIMKTKVSVKSLIPKLGVFIRQINRDIKKIESSINKAKKQQSNAARKLEKVLPGSVSLYAARLRRIQNRRTIPGIENLSRGELIHFGMDVKVYIKYTDDIRMLEDQLNAEHIKLSNTKAELSRANNELERCNKDLESIIPGSSNMNTISDIKRMTPNQITLNNYKFFSELTSSVQKKILKLIKLRNKKHDEIIDKLHKIYRMNSDIALHKENIDYGFIENAIMFTEDVYFDITNSQRVDRESLIYKVIFLIHCASFDTVCIDKLDIDKDIFNRLLSVQFKKNLYISSLYIPTSIPSNVKLIEVQP